jgi:ATPase subunit of ABC transporter with duplicated ATPase domains
MRKRVLLQTAVLLAATVNLSEVAASCFPPAKSGITPLDVLECLQSVLDTQQKQIDSQQKRIAELEKEAKRANRTQGTANDAIQRANRAQGTADHAVDLANRVKVGNCKVITGGCGTGMTGQPVHYMDRVSFGCPNDRPILHFLQFVRCGSSGLSIKGTCCTIVR